MNNVNRKSYNDTGRYKMNQTKYYYRNSEAPKPNKPNHIGTCIIVKLSDKILLEHRADSDVWGLIGGSLELNESFLDGIKRETREEAGIALNDDEIELYKIYDDPSRIIAYPNGNIIRSITVSYLTELNFAPQLKCSEESRELRFFSKSDLFLLNIAKTHEHILKDYLSG